MEDEIRNLIKLRGVNFQGQNYDFSSLDFNFIGKVDSFQDLEEFPSESLFIWHVSEGLTPLSIFEIERWSVDIPSGSHLIISERPLDDKLRYQDVGKNRVFFWGPNELSLWIGGAILKKEIQISITDSKKVDEDNFEIPVNQSIDDFIITLKPTVDISSWLSEKSLSSMAYTPVLICSKLWRIDGELVSPDGLVEKKKWEIIEDPWEDNFTIFLDAEVLKTSPSLRIIEPSDDAWNNESEVINSIRPLIDEKRQGKPQTSGSLTRSMILQNWIFRPDNCYLSSTKIFIPAWIINTEKRKLLHGTSGNTHSI